MKWVVIMILMMMTSAAATAQDSIQAERLRTEMQKADILKRDTVKKQHEIGVIRQTIRGFDRLQDYYGTDNAYL